MTRPSPRIEPALEPLPALEPESRVPLTPRIVVHGGAGAWSMQPEQLQRALEACERAARTGDAILREGGRALDAVEAAVRVLEDDPVLNAGIGSYRNVDGAIEMDAMIMDGSTLALGAVAIVRDVCNPVSLARRVMTDTKHTLLAGEGASKFADSIGFPRCNTSAWPAREPRPSVSDTVGAVALDAAANLACAVSTGGIPRKMPGRVGDSPLAGAGGYADNTSAGVAATGDGEAFMKLLASKRVADDVRAGTPVQDACVAALDEIYRRLEGTGGIIALDPAGNMGVAFTTPAMPYAWTEDGSVRLSAAPFGA